MKRVFCLLLLSLLGLHFFPAHGATPQAQVQGAAATFTARSDLVLVPVVVTDKHGSPLRGLSRDDFLVEENGKPQKIAIFEAMSATPGQVVRAAVPPNSFTNDVVAGEAPKALQIVALDLVNTSFTDQASARRGLLTYLSGSVQANTLTALVVIESNGIGVIHDFTSDPAVLVAALKQASGAISAVDTGSDLSRGATSNLSGSAYAAAVAAEAALLRDILEATSTSPGAISASRAQASAKQAEAMVAASRGNQAILVTLESLQYLAQHFAAVPGRKALIWATSGFPFTFGSTPGEITGGVRPEFYQRTWQMLNDANIAVYPVDVSGLVSGVFIPSVANRPQPLTSSIAQRSQALESIGQNDPDLFRRETVSTMEAFADMTGGEAFHNSNALAELFQRASRDSSDYYLLGYYLDRSGKNGWRRIKVRVNHEGAHARHRSGFFVTSTTLDPETSRRQDEQVAVNSPLDYTALPIMVTWRQIEPGAQRRVHFSLIVAPGLTEVDTEHENRISLDFVAVARDGKGDSRAQLSQAVDRKLPADAFQQVQRGGVTYAGALSVPAGDYTVRFVVRDNLSGRMGSVLAPLKVN